VRSALNTPPYRSLAALKISSGIGWHYLDKVKIWMFHSQFNHGDFVGESPPPFATKRRRRGRATKGHTAISRDGTSAVYPCFCFLAFQFSPTVTRRLEFQSVPQRLPEYILPVNRGLVLLLGTM
jgi:hypothetical protein